MSTFILPTAYALIPSGLRIESVESGPCWDGVRMEIHFKNGRGASIIRHSDSYGGREGLFEVAVLVRGKEALGIGPEWPIDYSTEITSDVLGWQSKEEVFQVLRAVNDLEPVPSPSLPEAPRNS